MSLESLTPGYTPPDDLALALTPARKEAIALVVRYQHPPEQAGDVPIASGVVEINSARLLEICEENATPTQAELAAILAFFFVADPPPPAE